MKAVTFAIIFSVLFASLVSEPINDSHLPARLNFLEEKEEAKEVAKTSWADKLTSLGSMFTTVGSMYQTVLGVFKSSKNNSIKEQIEKKGFNNLNQHSSVQTIRGIDEVDVPQFLIDIVDVLEIPQEKMKSFKMAIKLAFKAKTSYTWNGLSTVFSIEDGAKVVSANFFVIKEANGLYSVLFSDIVAEFKLAPNIIYYKKELSLLGGIWESENEVLEESKRPIMTDDIKTVLDFFSITAFKNFAEHFGVKLELPN